jgi:hypothetical protein
MIENCITSRMMVILIIAILYPIMGGNLVNVYASDGPEPMCEYRPFVEEGKHWTSIEVDGKDDYSRYFIAEYLIKGDTVIDSEPCKILWRKEYGGQYNKFRYLLEQDKKVFVIGEGYKWIIYDFGMAIGNSIQSGGYKATLEYVDTIIRTGKLYRRLHVNLRFDSESMHYNGKSVWIEGIGSPSGPLMAYDWHNSGTQTCSINGEIIFSSEDFDMPAWKEDTTGLEEWSFKTFEDVNSTYDLQGRRLTGAPRKGVYIRDGRKVVVK